MVTRAQVQEWSEAYRMAWESMDAAAAARLFSEDAAYRDNIFEEPHRGRDGVASYWSNVTAAQAEPRVRMGRPFVDGNRVALEFWTTMLVAGDELTLPGCMLLRFNDDGLCTDLREYWMTAPEITEPFAGWGE